MSFPRFSLSSFVTLFSFQGTIFYIDFKFKQVCVQFAFSSTSSRTSVRKTEKKCEMCVKLFELVEMRRIELLTPCLQGRCSPSWATPPNWVWRLCCLTPLRCQPLLRLFLRFLSKTNPSWATPPKVIFIHLWSRQPWGQVPSKLNNTDSRTCEQVLLTNDVRIALFLP